MQWFVVGYPASVELSAFLFVNFALIYTVSVLNQHQVNGTPIQGEI